jgi:hypothetical protein
MGQPVQMAIDVQIPRDKVAAALSAVAALGVAHATAGHATAKLVAALATFGFEAGVELPRGDVWIDVFRGRYWGDQERLFAALAPHAQGRVEVFARDGACWGYVFRNGLLVHEEVV